ncbi:MAG: hypothetical protein Q9165_005262 [Trypethelium subeluteriae]
MAPPGTPGYSHTANLLSAYNGVNAAGSIFGAAFTSWFAQWAGRKRNIQWGAVIVIIGGALCAGSVDVAMFIVSRFIAGFGIGMLITAIPMYQSEVSTPESRGFMTCMHGIKEAYAVLRRLHVSKEDPDGKEASREFYQMRKQLELDRRTKEKTGAFDVFMTPANRKRALCAFMLMFGLEFSGILVITNYGVLLYEQLGLSGYMPLLLSAIYVTITFPGNVFTALYVDKIGRRKIILVGLAGCIVCNIFECALQANFLETRQRSLEDIAEAFGDKVAVHYFNATEEEEAQYAAEAAMQKHGLTTEHLEDVSSGPNEKGID